MSDRICTYCGRTGHRASSCPRRASLVLAFCALIAGPASAAILGVAPSSQGGTIEVHDTVGVCTGRAHRALWVSADGKRRVEGCWDRAVGTDSLLNFVFVDVSIAQLPIASFTKPRTL
jgi:hypothetical protein